MALNCILRLALPAHPNLRLPRYVAVCGRMCCAMCHGEDGKPVLATAPDLRTSSMTVEERVAIIAYGKGTMPPHRNTLDMPSIRGLAVYIDKFTD